MRCRARFLARKRLRRRMRTAPRRTCRRYLPPPCRPWRNSTRPESTASFIITGDAVPRSFKVAAAVVSVLLLLVLVPGVGAFASQVLQIPGGVVAGAVIGAPAEGRTLAHGLTFFVLMVAIDLIAYTFVIQTVRQIIGRTEGPEEPADPGDER